MGASVEVWWTKGTEVAVPRDARMHCQADSFTSGLPANWRGGERSRFLSLVMQNYPGTEDLAGPDAHAKGWRFNSGAGRHLSLSDSGTHLVAAVGLGIPAGIDAERLKPVDDALQTLGRLGLKILPGQLAKLPPAARNRAFLTVWTAFEAFLKLERLAWDIGAARFAALEPHWRVSTSGSTRFQGSAQTGVVFQTVLIEEALILGIATPAACEISVRRAKLPKAPKPKSEIAVFGADF